MALDDGGLESALEAICEAPPATAAECAQAWADAMEAYASGIVPASTTVSAAAATLAGALTTAFGSPAAAPGMESAFAAFATTVGSGMVGYVPTPPPAPVGFATQFAGPKPETHADAASAIAGLIHAWMTTGIATLAAPPNTPLTWS